MTDARPTVTKPAGDEKRWPPGAAIMLVVIASVILWVPIIIWAVRYFR